MILIRFYPILILPTILGKENKNTVQFKNPNNLFCWDFFYLN